jgi:hypothetical protein
MAAAAALPSMAWLLPRLWRLQGEWGDPGQRRFQREGREVRGGSNMRVPLARGRNK